MRLFQLKTHKTETVGDIQTDRRP